MLGIILRGDTIYVVLSRYKTENFNRVRDAITGLRMRKCVNVSIVQELPSEINVGDGTLGMFDAKPWIRASKLILGPTPLKV